MCSERDKAILNSIFNPYLPLGENVFLNDISDIDSDYKDETEDKSENLIKSKTLELDAIMKAEQGNTNEAILLLNDAIEKAPERPSCYNNRAQVNRLIGNDDDAMNDLNKAIQLSKGQGKTGCQALCQRGLLYRKMGQDENARKDFQCASKLGCSFATNQLVQMNPYAAMCNQMLHEVMKKIGQPEAV